MTPEEQAFLDQSEVRECCGHLEALHNFHCCEFCMVPDCTCSWGAISTTPAVESRIINELMSNLTYQPFPVFPKSFFEPWKLEPDDAS